MGLSFLISAIQVVCLGTVQNEPTHWQSDLEKNFGYSTSSILGFSDHAFRCGVACQDFLQYGGAMV
jgi:hypothetical protein